MCSRLSTLAAVAALSVTVGAAQATASDQVYFSKDTNVTNILVSYINQETVRLDISSWYLSEHSISIAIANRFAAGVPVRIIGDRGAIFEADPHTKAEFYWLASQGIPIRLRFNPTWFPEIDHWKAAIFVGQNLVEFGSGNFAPTELAPNSSSNYDDDSEMFTSDPDIVNAFRSKFDRIWNDTTVEPESIIGGPPYLKDWNDACANEPTGNCADYHTLYPNPAPMNVNTARLEADYPTPPDLIWGQGPDFNNRLIQEINNENTHIDLVVYRLEVPEIAQALINKFKAGVPVRVLVDPNQYTNILYSEYWLTHAYIDQLFMAGIPVKQTMHQGVTHMKTLITSTYATNASSNYGPNWQRDHDYFVSAATKPAIYQAFVNNFNEMWNDSTDYGPLITTAPRATNLTSAGTTPSAGQAGVSSTPTLTWNTAAWATSYDIYLGTSSSNMALVANVPAQLVVNAPSTYSWTPSSALSSGTTYFWKVVSRTFANMTASSDTESFSVAGGATTLPSPWQSQDVGATGQAGSTAFSGGTFTVRGAGADIWGSADAFQFAYQPLTGDGSIVARVASIQNTNTYAKAGIMLRASVAASSQHVILDVRPTGDIEFMTRSSNGGSTSWLAGAAQGAPVWLKLTLSGSTVTGSISSDGSSWSVVESTSIAFPSTVDVGLIVTSHDTSTVNTSTFDSVAVSAAGSGLPGAPSSPSPANSATGVSTTPTLSWSSTGATSYDVAFGTSNPPPGVSSGQASATYAPTTLSNGTTYFWQIVAHNSAGVTTGPVWTFSTAAAAGLPSPWQSQDVGSTGQLGSTTFSGGTFTVRGAGADIWGSADAFQFVYQPLTGNGSIIARVTGIQNTNTYAKAGVMLRATTDAGSQHVILDLRPTGDIEFMTRPTAGSATNWLSGATHIAPVWLQLTRSGSTVVGSISSDGVTWSQVGTTTISFPSTIDVGLIVTSHDTSTLNTSTFDSVVSSTSGSAPGTPGSPSPAGSASGVSTSTTLTWSSTGATSYDVALGTGNPPSMASMGQAAASYSPSALTASTTYFWQITAHNSAGSTTGPIWSFTTAAAQTPPGTPGSPNPTNGASGLSLTPTLTWTATNASTYDVKFGTTNPPPTVSSGQAASSYSPSGLKNSTTYFWQIVANNGGGSTAGQVWSFTTTASASPTNIVIYASDISANAFHGAWSATSDSTAAAGVKASTPDLGVSNTSAPLASPTDYVDVSVNANAGVIYTFWIRLKATANSKFNDSIYVQFSDAEVGGSAIYQMNTTNGLVVNLATDTTGSSLNNWGWANGAYWLTQPATISFASSGTQTIRIQTREDGVQFDQIVLSPSQYFNSAASCPTTCAGAPGPVSNDATIVPKS